MTIGINLVYMALFALCIKAKLTIFNSSTPLEINTVWENRNIKILSVIEDFPGFLGIKEAFIKDFSYPRSVFLY